jgi:hypothetical protein
MSQTVQERIWSIYLMMRPELDQRHPSQEILRRFLEDRMQHGVHNEEQLMTEGLIYLTRLGLNKSG